MAIEIIRGSLVIRSLREADAGELSRAIHESVEHLRPWHAWVAAEPVSLEERRALIAGWMRDAERGGDLVAGAFLGDRLVASAGLHRRIGAGGLEIGYWVHQDFLRRGIATTAAAALTDVAFTLGDIDRVEIHHDRANVASGGVPRKLGFELVGQELRDLSAPGEIGVHLVWRVTREEWVRRSGT